MAIDVGQIHDEMERLRVEIGPPDAPRDPLPDLRLVADPMEEGGATSDPVRLYLRAIGRVKLLTAQDEVMLAERIEAGNEAAELFDSGAAVSEEALRDLLDRARVRHQVKQDRAGELPPAAVRGYLLRIADGGERAREHLISANLRLVVSVAKRYQRHGLALLDLIQEGNLGLMRAVEKFDHTLGYKFSTYATWWIRQAITRAIADQSRTIRVPVHMTETLNKLTKVQRLLAQELNREPTADELARAMDLTTERIRELRQIGWDPVSLETPIGEEQDGSLGELIEDRDAVAPVDAAGLSFMRRELREVIDTLSTRERMVLELRFGLVDGHIHTLEDVGQAFGVTRERVRQIEAKTLSKLRHPCRGLPLRDYLEA